MTMIRTQAVVDLHPADIVALFMEWDADDQTRFFNLVGAAMDKWPVLNRDTQFKEIASGLTPLGKEIVVGLRNWI